MLVSVLGPRPSRSARMEDSERCQVELLITPQSGVAGPREAELGSLLRQTLVPCLVLTAHPRKVLTVAVHVLADDGGAAAAAVNAALLALADAGMPLRCLAGAVTLGLAQGPSSSAGMGDGEDDGGVAQLDLTQEEAAAASATVMAVYSEGAEAPLAVLSAGPLPMRALEHALAVGRSAAASTVAFMRGALRDKVLRDASANFQGLLGVSLAELAGVAKEEA